ncbi:MAG: DUF4438 domain-containing protein [Candidatus Bathyarchaeota archaeon]|nr:DUF4438 domain-containing protein [Candidatus Termiticorpusculum sp.]
MLKTNREKLIKLSVMGEVTNPTLKNVYNISATGVPCILPGTGGITYNLRVGDSACDWEADHVEPCVSTANKENDARSGTAANTAYTILSCIGNQAIIASGDAKGETGTVTGKHGGVEHVLIDFKPETLDRLLIGDKIQIKTYGTGLKLLDFPEIKLVNMDPCLLDAINPQINNEKLQVPVTHLIPANIMGSGLGANQVNGGDYDIQLFDDSVVKQFGLEDLRLGDLVAIIDADHSYGRLYRKNAISIGVVVHANCVTAGHGPGVTSLMTSSNGKIIPQITQKANLASLLKLRADI